ncbi:MAG: hypothetical protein QNJ30_15905 [Kiloniellales bacterium]|nr:hypothetical protein [Kiloniellales bacterium]
MGGRLPDINVGGLLEQLNLRFGPNDAIKEMLVLQKEFGIFSEEHSLKQSFALLNLAPGNNWAHRRGWYEYLVKDLKACPSDKKDMSGEDRIISVLQRHLEKGEPIPVHFTTHDSRKDPRVKVSPRPKLALTYSTENFLVISLPMTPIEKNRAKRRAKSR